MHANLLLMVMLGLTMAITVLQATADDAPAHVHPAPRGLSEDSATRHNYRPLRRHKSYRERSRLHKKPKHAPAGSTRRLTESNLLESGYHDNDYDCRYHYRSSHCHGYDDSYDDSSDDNSDSSDDSYDRGHDDWYGGDYGPAGVYGFGPSYGYSGYGAYGGFNPFFYGYENAEVPVEAASTPADTVAIGAESAAPSKKPKPEKKSQQKPSTVKKVEKKVGKV